ncbi:MAG TPA: AMP-binding protein, partial [Paracoccaceae bacterium]|nr:AMP-binding protein [Paracoccaceae bacterium]
MIKTAIFDLGLPPECPQSFNLAQYVFSAGRATPDKTALRVVDETLTARETYTFSELEAAVLSTAHGLENSGITKGDRILLRVGNSVDFPILFFAASAIGAIPVPSSTMLTHAEVAFLVADLEPKLVCASEDLDSGLPDNCRILTQTEFRAFRSLPYAHYADTRRDDPAYMVYTSGTGGKPKGVLHAHRAAYARRMMWADWYGLSHDDRVLHAGAFNWTYTLGAGLTDPWAAGAQAIIYSGPSRKDIWADIAERNHATIFAAVPGVYRQLLSTGHGLRDKFSTLRHGLTAGESLPPAIDAQWRKKTGKPLYEALGMSEIS